MQATTHSAASVSKTAAVADVRPKANLTTAQMRAGGKAAKVSVERLRGNVSLVTGSGGNILVQSGADGKTVVESGFATSRSQVSEALRSISPTPLQLLINTHWHFDHTDGNEWMHAEGATIMAHQRTLTRMKQEQTIPEFEGVYPPSPAGALPTVTFERSKTVMSNGQEVLLTQYTPAHTDTDISVFLADADVIHTGDTFFSQDYPFIDYNSGGSIDGMIAACRETLDLIGPSTILVGGHGPPGTSSDLVSFLQMLVQSRSRVAALKQGGASASEVIAKRPTGLFDDKWGNGFVSPELFTWLVYRGI